MSKSAGRSQIKDDQRSMNIVSDTSSSKGTCTSLLKTATFQKDDQSTDGHISETSNLRVFSFAELKNATRNFRPDSILGEGGFGRVFKGWVNEKTLARSKADTGMIVAIKKRNQESLQGFEEWEVLFCNSNKLLNILLLVILYFIKSNPCLAKNGKKNLNKLCPVEHIRIYRMSTIRILFIFTLFSASNHFTL